MNRIEQLIKKYCSDGVSYVTLNEICEVKGRIGFRGYKREDQVNEGEGAISLSPSNIQNGNIVYDNCTYITWDKYEESPEIQIEIGDIVFGKTASVGKTAIVKELPEKATINPQLVVLKKIKCNNDYLSYVLKTNEFQNKVNRIKGFGTVPTISQKDLCNLTVPVPPLEIQSEIVNILDEYTESVTALQQELEKELTARKKQYEYYRELILDKNNEAKWISLLDVAETYTGLTYKPEDTAKSGTIVLRSSNIKNSKLVFDDNVYVQMSNIPQRAIVQENDLLICVRNGSKALIGKAAMIPKTEEKMAYGAFMTILRSNDKINPKYLFFVWQSPRIQNMIHGDSGMPINQITKSMLEKIQVPLPSLETQENIVSILDSFDKLYNDISEKLSAEIESRRKQYEYYRDKLLSFKE